MTETSSAVLAALHAVRDLPYDDEPVDQLQHALQCAALARAAGADRELVVAALLHDIGRSPAVRHGVRAADHGRVAGEWLAPRLGERVAWLAEQHVPAKRYLCAVDGAYRARLTPASERSLRAQGDPMSPAEVADAEAHPWWADALALRRWDDEAKNPRATVPGPEAYLDDVDGVAAASVGLHGASARRR